MTGRLETPDILGAVLSKEPDASTLRIAEIRRDGGTQPRAGLDEVHVQDIVDAIKRGEEMPAVDIVFDGTNYWLIDGFHRVEAYSRIPKYTVLANIRPGSQADAQWASYGANRAHGLKRTNDDKRRQVLAALKHPNAASMSNVKIAKHCGVDEATVRNYREKLEFTSEIPKSDARVGADGRTINTSNIGSNQPQYVSIWELQRRVDEHARTNGWQAPMLRSAARNQRNDGNYLLLEAAITVEYRRSDLVQAIHNVANQWEDREEQQRRAKEWQVVQLPADIADAGYQVHWKAAEGWRVLDADGGHVQSGLNSLTECATLIRQRVAPAGKPLMGVFKTAEEEAYVAEALDIAAREAAADEAERQAVAASNDTWRNFPLPTDIADSGYKVRWDPVRDWHILDPDGGYVQAEGLHDVDDCIRVIRQLTTVARATADDSVDPWAAAVATPGSRQQRVEAIARAITPWLQDYRDAWGRSWHDIENPSHTNGTLYQKLRLEMASRHIVPADETLKLAIKQAFSWMLADASESPVTEVTAAGNADEGKPLVEWTDDDWFAYYAQREQPQPQQPDEAAIAAVLTPDETPVSFRPDYDSDEWYTPAEYIEAARRTMGSIDLDPATCELAQTVVQADVYLTKFENGIVQQWIRENVWLNPPYGQADPWVAKLLAEYDKGAFVKQAIVLLNNMTETGYFQSLLTRFPVCFPNRRIPFWRHDQQGLTGRQGQALFYLGPNVERFVEVFGAFGPVLRRME